MERTSLLTLSIHPTVLPFSASRMTMWLIPVVAAVFSSAGRKPHHFARLDLLHRAALALPPTESGSAERNRGRALCRARTSHGQAESRGRVALTSTQEGRPNNDSIESFRGNVGVGIRGDKPRPIAITPATVARFSATSMASADRSTPTTRPEGPINLAMREMRCQCRIRDREHTCRALCRTASGPLR